MGTASTSFYITGGTLRQDAPSYVERRADQQLYEGLRRGEFCYVLTSRQMGKSSLMVHTAARLRQAGMAVAVLDLTLVGQNLSPEQWYGSLLDLLGRQLDLEDELDDFWLADDQQSPLQRWVSALREVVLPRVVWGSGTRGEVPAGRSDAGAATASLPSAPWLPAPEAKRLVIFIDEIDAVRSLPFSTDEFFAAIRACYNRRSEEPEFNSLAFCLLGVATPSDLIQDTRTTPFNIGKRIELTDFTAGEAAPLAQGLGHDPQTSRALLHRVLHWTGGHPYLTQRLCQAVAEEARRQTADGRRQTDGESPPLLPCSVSHPPSPAVVDRLCEALFLSPQAREQDDNLLFVRDRLLKSEVDRASLLDLYEQVHSGKTVRLDDTNQLVSLLRLSGIVRLTHGYLRVRNRIYARVFGREWVTTHMPDAELRRQRAAYRRGLLRASGVAAAILAMMAGLALTALNQARRANQNAHRANQNARQALQLLSQAQAERGVRLLEEENPLGLLDLLQARQTVETIPEARASRASLWSGWCQACAGRLAQVVGGGEATAFSPDGQLLATAARDGSVRVWESATGRPYGPPLQHRQLVLAVAFSPDGKLLAAGSDDGTARLWDTATRRPHGPPLRHRGSVTAVAFSPDGKLLATESRDGARLWETTTGRPHGPLLRYRGGWINALTFSPDGKLLATASHDGPARLWETATGRPHGPGLPTHPGGVVPMAFSPDGKLLATETILGAQLWETTAGRPHGPRLEHDREVTALAFSPDGKLLATASGDGTARLWQTATGRADCPPLRHQNVVEAVAFSPDGKLLATGSDDGTARLWDPATGGAVGPPMFHQGAVFWVAFRPDGKLLATRSRDGTTRLWETAIRQAHGRPLGRPQRRFPVEAVAFSPDGKLLAMGSFGCAALWETAIGRPWGLPFRQPGWGWINTVTFSPDGKLLATATGDGAELWETDSGRPHHPPLQHPEGANTVAISPDGKLLATGSSYSTQLWEVATGRSRGRRFLPGSGALSVAFSPDGALLAMGLNDGTAQILKTVAGQPVGQPLRHQGAVEAVAFSPDGKLLATGSHDGTARLWDPATGRLWGPPLRQPRPIQSVAFSPNGRLLATQSEDGACQLWETGTGQPCGPPLRERHLVFGRNVAFSPDGRLLATGSEDGTAHLWPIPRAPADLREMELRTWVALGARLDAQGGVEAIPWQEWQQLRAELRGRKSD